MLSNFSLFDRVFGLLYVIAVVRVAMPHLLWLPFAELEVLGLGSKIGRHFVGYTLARVGFHRWTTNSEALVDWKGPPKLRYSRGKNNHGSQVTVLAPSERFGLYAQMTRSVSLTIGYSNS